jgi:hypothetical protein
MAHALDEGMEIFAGALLALSGVILLLGRAQVDDQVMSHEWLRDHLKNTEQIIRRHEPRQWM